MPPSRLSALDASFLTAETPTAHMHIGWVALFDPPDDAPAPTFAELREHVGSRLSRAPRYRQLLAQVPFGLHTAVWVDDEQFELDRHVIPAPGSDFRSIVEMAMSTPLERSRPLWELWIADSLPDGRIGIVGKVHHCMVDGLAAVELGALLLDPSADPPVAQPDDWQPRRHPSRIGLAAQAAVDRVRGNLDLVRVPAGLVASPRRLAELAAEGRRAALAASRAFSTPAPPTALNGPISPLRRLGTISRPLQELRLIKRRYGVTINDVVLAVCAGAARSYFEARGEQPVRLKTMVPVSVRDPGSELDLGNRISFIFVELPCDEPDPVARLAEISSVMTERKESDEPLAAKTVVELAGRTPGPIQRALTSLVLSPRTFNLVVSNIPGPPEPLYMRGCRLAEAYPVVPIADGHALSIGVTTIGEQACFGLYADRKTLPDVDVLASAVGDAFDELLTHAGAPRSSRGAQNGGAGEQVRESHASPAPEPAIAPGPSRS